MVTLGEDGARIWLNKPAGIPVFPPHADPSGDCVLRRLVALDPGRIAHAWPAGFEGGLAHRLDTATSGLVVAARAPADLDALREEFRSGALRKLYLFRSSADPAFEERLVDVPIAHHPRRADRMVAQRPTGRTSHRGRWYAARTRLRRLQGGWWEAEIRTGVTHQIRVHAAFAGVPLDGDPLYAPPADPPPRYCLHALRIVAPLWRSPDAPLPPGLPPLPTVR